MRQSIGELALDKGFITRGQWEQTVTAARAGSRDPSALLVERGFLSQVQFKRTFAQWKLEERLLADNLVASGLLRWPDLNKAIAACRQARKQGFFQSVLRQLLADGVLTRAQLEHHAGRRAEAIYSCGKPSCGEQFPLQVPSATPAKLALPCPLCGGALERGADDPGADAFSIIGDLGDLGSGGISPSTRVTVAPGALRREATVPSVPPEQIEREAVTPRVISASTTQPPSGTAVVDPVLGEARPVRPPAPLSTPSRGSAAQDPLLGSKLGPWHLKGLLGKGGMGAVYQARHTQTGADAAVKVILPGVARDASFLDRFEREAKAASAIDSEHVIRCVDFHRENPTYMALEFVDGETLKALIKRVKRIEVERALEVGRKVLLGLQAAHECPARVIHRDLKPENVLLGKDGAVKVADFGLARRSGQETLALTVTGTVMGTPSYMSPEQIRDSKSVGPASDLYSFGAMLFHMLAGRPPFMSSNPRTILNMHVAKEPPDLAEYNDRVTPQLAQLVARLLAKYPHERYPSARACVEALDALQQGGTLIVQGGMQASPHHTVELKRGDWVGKWRIQRELGRGGVGIVYEAYGERGNVAMKVLASHTLSDVTHLMRFHQEWKAASQVKSPHVVEVYEWSKAEVQNATLHFLVMELVSGKSLADRVVEEGLLDVDVASDLIRQAALGLKAAHQQGIVHRDVKPENILIATDSGETSIDITDSGNVKVADFGLARFYEKQSELTAEQVIGSPYYMSPEQGAGEPIDPRSDVYSLGATFYYALTGARPFTGDSPQAVIYQHGHVLPKPPNERNGEIPKGLSLIVEKMLLKKKEDRFQTIDEFLQALDGFSDGSLKVLELQREVKAGRKPFEPRKKSRTPLLIGVLLLLVAVLVGALIWAPRAGADKRAEWDTGFAALVEAVDAERPAFAAAALDASTLKGLRDRLTRLDPLAEELGSDEERATFAALEAELEGWQQELTRRAAARSLAEEGMRVAGQDYEASYDKLYRAISAGIEDSLYLATLALQKRRIEQLKAEWQRVRGVVARMREDIDPDVGDTLRVFRERVRTLYPSLSATVNDTLVWVLEELSSEENQAEVEARAQLAVADGLREAGNESYVGLYDAYLSIYEQFEATRAGNTAKGQAREVLERRAADAMRALDALDAVGSQAATAFTEEQPEHYDAAIDALARLPAVFGPVSDPTSGRQLEPTEAWLAGERVRGRLRERRAEQARYLAERAERSLALRRVGLARTSLEAARAFEEPALAERLDAVAKGIDSLEMLKEGMVLIEGVTAFSLGADASDLPLASPIHTVAVESFRIDPNETQVQAYRTFLDELRALPAGSDHRERGLCHPDEPEGYDHTPHGWQDQTAHPRRPVVGVSWYDAYAYARWAGKSLPSEAQWELAARGAEGRPFPWGDAAYETRCHYAKAEPAEVGSYPNGATPQGVLDLAGNAFEWTRDWYDAYPGGEPRPEHGQEARVVRGGSFQSFIEQQLRSANRAYFPPGDKNPQVGFRCVAEQP